MSGATPTRHRETHFSPIHLLVPLLLSICCLGCGPSISDVAKTYDYERSNRVPPGSVVLVSGFLGSTLFDLDSKKVVWGEFGSGALRIKKPDVQRRIALPILGGDRLAALRDRVVARDTFLNADIVIGSKRITVNAYPGTVVGMLVGAAKPSADKGPPTKRTLRRHTRDVGSHAAVGVHGFAYDWRRDVSEAAAELDVAVRAAHDDARARGLEGEAARVDLLAHSLGCLVTRYYLRYGTQPLPKDGSLPTLDWSGASLVRRAILL